MVDRILQLIRERKLSPSQFADEIGIQRSGISHIISGRNKPSLEFVMKILKRYPEVQPDWLLYGTPGPETGMVSGSSEYDEPEADPGAGKGQAAPVAATLFDEIDTTASIKPENKSQLRLKKDKAERKIEKIVVFYDDRSFREYEPEK